MGGSSGSAPRPALPSGLTEITHWIALHYLDESSGEPVEGAEYEIHLKGGGKLSGKLNAKGEAQHDNVDQKDVKQVVYKARTPEKEEPHPGLQDILG